MLRILVFISFCLLPLSAHAGDEPGDPPRAPVRSQCEDKNLSASDLAAGPLVDLASFRRARQIQASRAAAATSEPIASAGPSTPGPAAGPSQLVNASFAAAHLGFRRDFSLGSIFFDLGIRLPGAPIPESQVTDLGFGGSDNLEGLVDYVSAPVSSPQVLSELVAAPQGDLFAATLTRAIEPTGGRHYSDSVILFRLRRDGRAIFEYLASPGSIHEGRFAHPAFIGPNASLLRVALQSEPVPPTDGPARVVFPKNLDIFLYRLGGTDQVLPAPARLSGLFQERIERVELLSNDLFLVKFEGGRRPVIVPVDSRTQSFGSPIGLHPDTALAAHGATTGAIVEVRETGARLVLRTGTVVTIRYGASVVEEIRPLLLEENRGLVLSMGSLDHFLEVVGERVSYVRGTERAVIRDLGYKVDDIIRVNGSIHTVAVREGNHIRAFELLDSSAEVVGDWNLNDSDLPLHRLVKVEGGFFAPRDDFRSHAIFLGANGLVERLPVPPGGILLESFNRNFYFRARPPEGASFPLELRFFGESQRW